MEVKLKCKSGYKSFPFQKAEAILRAKKVNPSQTWELDDPKFQFDGQNITRVPKKEKEVKE